MLRSSIISILFLSALLSVQYSSAQSFEEYRKMMDAEFGKFKTQSDNQYNDFYKEINTKYAEFMKLAWEEFKTEPVVHPPKPNPPIQPVFDPKKDVSAQTEVPKPRHIRFVKELINKVFPAKPIPEEPIAVLDDQDKVVEEVRVVEEQIEPLDMDFFGEKCTFRVNKGAICHTMEDCKEANVSKYWAKLAKGKINPLINDCLAVREKLNLCDWGYWQLVKSLSHTIYDENNKREAIVLQAYIMTQSGYKVRLGRIGAELVILISSDSTIYETSYLIIDGTKFYSMDKSGSMINVCNFQFPGESVFSLQMNQLPLFPVDSISGQELHSPKLGEKRVKINHNRNMINFLDTYPQCSIDNFTHASLDSLSKQVLYPALKDVIKGKTEEESANILIDFVQSAFKYKVDDEQFGQERTLFANETLFYPFSDCEDRSLLFATLIRELLGLKVVLLDYPEHIATAVRFNQDIEGDYMIINGEKYLVCDPTYIGADIGNCMPMFQEVAASVINIE